MRVLCWWVGSPEATVGTGSVTPTRPTRQKLSEFVGGNVPHLRGFPPLISSSRASVAWRSVLGLSSRASVAWRSAFFFVDDQNCRLPRPSRSGKLALSPESGLAVTNPPVIASLFCAAICFWIAIIGDLRSVRRPDSSVESGLGLLLPYCRIEKRNLAYERSEWCETIQTPITEMA